MAAALLGAIAGWGIGLYTGAPLPEPAVRGAPGKRELPQPGPANTLGKIPRPSADSQPGLQSDAELRGILDAPEGLRRRRDFLNWLGGVGSGNWKTGWELFAEATKGRSGANAEEENQLLMRLGEVAGREAMEYFGPLEIREEDPTKSAAVLSSWAAQDPEAAMDFATVLPTDTSLKALFAGKMESALIKGTGRRDVASLKELAESFDIEAIWQKGKEFVDSARQRGEVEDAEAIWRRVQERRSEAYPTAPPDVGRQMFYALVTWKAEAAEASGTGTSLLKWMTGIMDEGFDIGEDELGQAGHVAAATAPAEALQWASETAARLQNDPQQQQRMIRQQGWEAARNWAKTDPESLSRWLTSNPDQLAYDAGAAALYAAMKDSDSPAAAAWGATVKDKALRQWIKLDP